MQKKEKRRPMQVGFRRDDHNNDNGDNDNSVIVIEGDHRGSGVTWPAALRTRRYAHADGIILRFNPQIYPSWICGF